MSEKSPFKALWTVQPNQIWASEYPGDPNPEQAAAKLSWLLHLGVCHFLDLTDEGERNARGLTLLPYYGLLHELAARRGVRVRYVRFPIKDLSIPSVSTMREILSTVSEGLRLNERVLVHCLGGRGRSGTVAACWLIEQGRSADEALIEIALRRADAGLSKFPRAPEMACQVEFVRRWRRGG